MQRLRDDILFFLRNKCYLIMLLITTVSCYGFAITHVSIGIDDTIVDLYLQDGLAVVMGRWTMYLLNKVFHFGEYMPFITEFAGVILLLIAVVLFCVMLKRILGDKIGILGYTAFACTFVSYPLISEVYIYYYHNGVDLGYVLCASALLLFLSILDKKGKAAVAGAVGSMLFLWAAIGCYESFVVVYIIGVILILFFQGMKGREKITFKLLFRSFVLCFCQIAGCILLRMLMIKFLTAFFSLQGLASAEEYRSVGDGLRQLMSQDAWLSETIMILKRYWMVYCVNGVAYFPITVYMLAAAVFGVASLILTVRQKSGWYPLMVIGMLLVPVMLCFAPMRVPSYRSCQYLPLFVASAVLLLGTVFENIKWKKYGNFIYAIAAVILVWNQSFEMNRNFYTDYRKYEYTKELMIEIAQTIEEYGASAPVIFTGGYALPYEIVKDYYTSYFSPEYRRLQVVSNWLGDPHLIEKYHSPYGYYYEGEAQNSLITWGLRAFDRPGLELMHFLQMHGYELNVVTDKSIWEEAEHFSEGLPEYPDKGSVIEMDGYVIVHF